VLVGIITAVAIALGPAIAIEVLEIIGLTIAVLVEAIGHAELGGRKHLVRAEAPKGSFAAFNAACTHTDAFGACGAIIARPRVTQGARACSLCFTPIAGVFVAI